MKIHGVCDFFSKVGEGFCTAGRVILNGTQRVAMAILSCPINAARGCFLAGRAVVGCVGRAIRGTSRKAADTFFEIFAPRELREYNQKIRTVLSKLKNNSFSQEETFNALKEIANSDIILPERNIRPIREAFSLLLDRGEFTVRHSLEETPEIFPRKWEGEKLITNDAAKASIERITTGSFWTKTTLVDGSSCEKSIESEQIQALTAFYTKKLGVTDTDPEDLVYHLMLRFSADYAGTAIFSALNVFSLDRMYCLGTGEAGEDNGYHFGFENGIAKAYQTSYHTKMDPTGKVLQRLEITRSISLDPQNISSAWDEVVTIRKLG